MFSHPRYAAGAATNPDPDVFAYAAATVKHCIDVYTGRPPYRKADMDYFLDRNLPIVGKGD